VPGDIVIVIEGDLVSADSLLIENYNITTNEAALTGESSPVEKSIQQCITHDTPLHERRYILYAGTMVTSGRGKAIVFRTGAQNELGKITTQVATVSCDKTPFQRKMDQIGRPLVGITIIVSIITILTGIYRENPLIGYSKIIVNK
jgi:Ca2+-transporting ATPase